MRAPAALLLAVGLILAVAAPTSADEGAHDGHGPAGTTGPAPAELAVPTEGPIVRDHPHGGDLAALLASVPDGGELRLPAGTYKGPVVIDRPVRIVGEGLPLIDGDGTGSVITIRAAGTELHGLAVRGSGPGPTGNPAGVRIEADDVRIEGVVVEATYTGIAVASAERVALVGNVVRGRVHAAIDDDAHAVEHDGGPATITATAGTGHAGHQHAGWERGDGIWLHDSHGVLVQGNLVEDARDGIFLMFADRTLVDANHIRRSRYAVHSMWAEDLAVAENLFAGNLSGAVLMYGADVLLLKNTIQHNRSPSTGFGLLLKDVVSVQADRNVVADNRIGLHLDGPAGTEIQTVLTANTVARNHIGVAAYSSARAAFRQNSFADNLVQVMPHGDSLAGIDWIHRGAGNYWSTYRGYASPEPGLGATPHAEGGAVDRLLLRNPELSAIADSPALRLLRSIQERWGTRKPAAVDHVPLTKPVSPAVPHPGGDPVGAATTFVLAALLLTPSTLVLWRPRRRPLHLRRPADAVTT